MSKAEYDAHCQGELPPHFDYCEHRHLPLEVCGCWQHSLFEAGKTVATLQNSRVITLDTKSVKAIAQQIFDTEIPYDRTS